MARTSSSTKARIADAYWSLLSKYKHSEITVGMIVAEAGCSRGTFYYHFEDINALSTYALDQNFADDGEFLKNLTFMLNKDMDMLRHGLFSDQRLVRADLALSKLDTAFVIRRANDANLSSWCRLMQCRTDELTNDTAAIMEYATSGILGLMAYNGRAVLHGNKTNIPADLVYASSTMVIDSLCTAQGVSRAEVLYQLRNLAKSA